MYFCLVPITTFILKYHFLHYSHLPFPNTTLRNLPTHMHSHFFSTFCLWPAMASTGRAYFPVTRLLVGWTPEKNASRPLPDLGALTL